MTTEQQQAMDLEFRAAGVNPRDTLPLLGRRVWIVAAQQAAISGDLADRVSDLGGNVLLLIDAADLVVIPAGMEHRFTAHIRKAASRFGIGVLFDVHIDALIEANSQHALCVAEWSK